MRDQYSISTTFEKERKMGERTFTGDADALSNEEKILVVNAWNLLDQTREQASKVRGMDLTWRLQLRSDCKTLEKTLREIEKHPDSARVEKLKKAYLILQTSAKNILECSDTGAFF